MQTLYKLTLSLRKSDRVNWEKSTHFYKFFKIKLPKIIKPCETWNQTMCSFTFLMPKTSSLLDFSSGSLPSISFQKCFRTFFTSTSLTLAHFVRALSSHSCYEKSASWIFLAAHYFRTPLLKPNGFSRCVNHSPWRTSFGLCPHIRATKNPLLFFNA